MGFQTGLAVPAECPVGEVDMDPEPVIERLPHARNLFALSDGVGGHKGCADGCLLHELGGLEIPAGYIVDFTGGFIGLPSLVHVDRQDIFLLGLALEGIAHKGRITQC